MSEASLVPLSNLLLESQNGLSKRHGEGVPVAVLRLADILDGQIEESSPRTINLSGKEIAKYGLQQGDLVCIRVNGSKAPISVPSLNKQAEVVDEVERCLSISREVESEVNTNLQRAQALRQATLAKAFSTN